MKWCADFETVNDENDCRVWAWALLSIDEEHYYTGNNIDSFFDQLKKIGKADVYFHNLKFDGEFILYYLFRNGYEYSKDREPMTFNTLIGDMGQFYCIEVIFEKRKKAYKNIKFYDSLKIIPLKIAEMPKAFNLDIQKLEIEYDANRPVGYELTDAEKAYLKNDVLIAARSLRFFFDQGLKGMTIGAMALNDFKQDMIAEWDKLFPMSVELDQEIRQCYKGAFTYLKRGEEDKIQGEGMVFDVNSLYPSVMRNRPMPYGLPKKFIGEYKEDNVYPYFIIIFQCSFRLKKAYLPTIQLKNNLSFIPTEYIESTHGEVITLCLTCTDYYLLMEHYDVFDLEYFVGYKFKTSTKIFSGFIDKWTEVKIQATKEGNAGLRTIAKLMLNNLYGKFASNPISRSKIPVYDKEEDKISYQLGEKEERRVMYIPVGSAITAYARDVTIRSAQANYDRFIYADTDSLHLKGTEPPTGLDVDPVKLGAWKHESTFTRAKFIRAKSYVEEIDGKLKVTCAGLPAGCHDQVTFDNFARSAEFNGKLQAHRVSGGVVISETTFKIKG